jgi:hypothetical protein
MWHIRKWRSLPMDKGRFKSIVSALKQYPLTEVEKRFVRLTEQHFAEKGILNEEQESVLEGIYREKKKYGKGIDFFGKRSFKSSVAP